MPAMASSSRIRRTPLARIVLTAACGLWSLGCVTPGDEVGTRSDEVVYGDDDRTDVYAHPSAFWRGVARQSIVALVPEGDVDDADPRDVQLLGPPLRVSRDLCEGERFREQPTAANCSGTLVDLDLVLTAGHCVRSDDDCARQRFVFDYLYDADGELATIDADEDVYRCGELVAREDDGSVDYALVRLDRIVHPSHVPAPVRREDSALPMDHPLVVLGFGSGLPLKIDDGGQVTAPNADTLEWFGANLDTFGGNSGSGVFDDDGNVVGILVRGEPDYESRGDCQVVAVLPNLPDDGRDEDCTYVARALEGLCATGTSTVLCESEGGLCRACRGRPDCPDDLQCVDGACIPRCGPAGCPDGFTCFDDGLCHADVTLVCEGRDVVAMRCDRSGEVVESCPSACEAGVCVDGPAGDTCETAIPIEPVNQTLTGTHGRFHTNEGRGSCAGNGVDTIYSFTIDRRYAFEGTATGFDTVLHMRRACEDPDTELGCDDDGGPRFGSNLFLRELEAGTYYLYMDTFGDRSGTYTLDLLFSALEEPDAGPPDAGPADAGPPPSDAGPPVDAGRDAGPARPDVGPVPPLPDAGRDAGRPGVDAFVPADAPLDAGRTFDKVRWGCGGCATTPGAATGPATGLWPIAFAWLLFRRRR